MPGGRPTIYRPELCEEVIPLLKQGMSIEEIGLELDVGYSTIYKWMDLYPEFREAIKKGREFSHGWWLKAGRENLAGKDFNSGLWFMNMKNRFGWRNEQKEDVNESTKSLIEKIVEKL